MTASAGRALPTLVYTVKEAAAILRVGLRTVWRRIDEGELVPCDTGGKESCVLASSVAEYVERRAGKRKKG